MAARFFLVLTAVFAAAGCNLGTSIGTVDAGTPDAGVVLISCADASECPVDAPECSFGICKRPCASSSGCTDLRTYCNVSTGYCEEGCRDSSTCPGGEVCNNGACLQGASCGSKCDCAAGQVCVAGSCQAPPATCVSNVDCARGADLCEAAGCNTFTGQCFNPNPDPCNVDGDCAGRPGCENGCVCSATQVCVERVACTGPQDCPGGQFCDTNGACEIALCNNGGITCDPGQTCGADGRCVTSGNGSACTNDNQCPSNQYCAVVAGQGGQCANGCRDNTACEPNQQCNGSHQCVGTGGGLGAEGDSCVNNSGQADDSLCQTGLVCSPGAGTCQESCAGYLRHECAGQAGCCELTGHPCCNAAFTCTDGIFDSGECFPFDP